MFLSLLDAQCTLHELTNGAGQRLSSQRYDLFGQVRASSGAWQSAFGYTGQQANATDGTVYLRARMYNPALDRFLQRDSFAGYSQIPQTLDRYAYADTTPLATLPRTRSGSTTGLASRRWRNRGTGRVMLSVPFATTLPS